MSPPAGNGSSKPQTLTSRIMGAFTGPASSGGSEDDQETPEILPAGERKAAMSTLNQQETKWALGGLILATVAGIAIPIYFVSANKVTKAGKNSIAVAPDAKLLGGVILIICAIGFAPSGRGSAPCRVHSLPGGIRVHRLHRAHRVRLHSPRRVAHAAGLAYQQVRHH